MKGREGEIRERARAEKRAETERERESYEK